LKAECLAQIETAFQKAEAHYGRKIKRVPVVFSNRMTHCGGIATSNVDYRTGKCTGVEIRLSAVLLAQNGKDFIKQVPGHEAAHIIADEIYGTRTKGHDRLWKGVMAIIGLTPDTYHNYKTPKTPTVLYRDSNGVEKQLTKIRHGKLQRGTATCYTWKDGIVMRKGDFVA
jgi:SprT protein